MKPRLEIIVGGRLRRRGIFPWLGAALIVVIGSSANCQGVFAASVRKEVVKMKRESQTRDATGVRAEVAASKRGDAAARDALQQRIERGDREDLASLLSMLDEIDEPKVLHHLANKTLDDERPLAGGEQSGRRICDAAADAFVARLGLAPVGGEPPYSPEQRAEVLKGIRANLPM